MNLNDKIKITVDSSADINENTLKKSNIGLAYLKTIDHTTNKEYLDGTLSNEELFKILELGHRVTTSAPNISEYRELFNAHLKEYERIVHFSMSDKISGSFQNALAAKNEIDSEKITIINTNQVSGGLSLIVLNALDYLKENVDFNGFFQKIKGEVSNCQLQIILHSAKYVLMGGRIEKVLGPTLKETMIASAISKVAVHGSDLAEKMKIRYILDMENGMFTNKKITRGSSFKVATNCFENILKDILEIDAYRISLITSNELEELNRIIDSIENMKYITNIEKVKTGTVISNYSGPNALALAYIKR